MEEEPDTEATEASQPATEATETSEPATEATETSEPATEATETSQPATETTAAEPETVAEPEIHPEESAPVETAETAENADKQSITSVNLGTPTGSIHSIEGEPVIDLEGGATDEFPKENAVFDESDTSRTPKVEGEEASEEGEKPPTEHKLSHDETDQIQAAHTTSAEEINLDNIRKSIIDPELVQSAQNIFGQPRSPLGPVVSISSSSEEEEEEEELESDIRSYLAEFGLQPEKKEPINREQYEEDYRNLREISLKLRRKNGLLHKKISEYYRKRKLTRVFEETSTDIYETLVEKYEERIKDYEELQIQTSREKEAVDNEMKDMMNLRDEQLAELEKSFDEMLAREQEIGHGLIDSKTGKAISDKVVERLVYRQRVKSQEIAKIRLAFIKRRDKVKQIDNKIKALETIGGTLHLMDFEQLRMENQTYSDKIEERDEELMRLRDRYYHAMQNLAHIREKVNIIEVQIESLHEKKCLEDDSVSKCREYLNELKIQRDSNRSQKDKLKLSTGVLTYSKLLLDMELGIKEREDLHHKLEVLRETSQQNREKLQNIRILMEKTEGKGPQRKVKMKSAVTSGPRYYTNRPTITYPVLPKIAMLKSRLDKLKLEN